jgi:homoserine kinase type II
MAVYTTLSKADVQSFLALYTCGEYVDHAGITGGIENTNYYVTTTAGRWVLTVFEVLNAQQLPYYLELTAHLKAKGLAVSAPCRLNDGSLMNILHGKPAALAQCLAGSDVMPPTAAHCAVVGKLLAQMHQASADFPLHQPNLRGLAWWQATVPTLYTHVSAPIAALLAEELAAQTQFATTAEYTALPCGAVHADLFCNNVLIAPDGSAGAIDFFFAGDDSYLFDLCVTLNDWCLERDYDDGSFGDKIRSNGALHPARYAAFIQNYTAQRPLTAAEQHALPMMARAAAFRFWVSRLNDWYRPRAASTLIPHDPTHFERVLRARRAHPLDLESKPL